MLTPPTFGSVCYGSLANPNTGVEREEKFELIPAFGAWVNGAIVKSRLGWKDNELLSQSY